MGVLSSRILVAGGGGGGGGNFGTANDNGGAGGGLTGANGAYIASGSVVAGGGTSSSGGVGNRWDTWGASQSGSLGLGGDAQATDVTSGSTYLNGGGGGGGGYYGGGGGSWVGGGGGSSYTHPTRASLVTHTQGTRSGNGLLTITYSAAPATISIATSGNVSTVSKGQAAVLISNINYPGKIYFYADGKKIPGCTGMQVSSGTISCNWKPSNMKKVSIYASYTPTGAASETKSSSIFVNVIRRAGKR